MPFIGNLTGTALAVLMVVAQGGGQTMIVGVLVTYGVIQFLQSNIIQPLVVGAEVNLNPMATIFGVLAGGMIWGIAGMILSVPLLGMLKIMCDHVEPLKPYGFLLGPQAGKKKENGLKEKIKGWFGKK